MALRKDNHTKIYYPVDVLAPESNLERLLKSLSYAPALFDSNSKMSTYQKFKKTIVFGLLSSLLCIKVEKSFEPLIG